MILMTVTGFVLLVGITLTLWWGGTSYETWEPRVGDAASRRVRRQRLLSARTALRSLAVVV
jgi:hypothetical protein